MIRWTSCLNWHWLVSTEAAPRHTADPLQTAVTPNVKWKMYDGGTDGWAVLVGDNVFIPAQSRTYDAGNYFYREISEL